MNYQDWRDDIFGQPSDSEPACLELREETVSIQDDMTLDYVDRALADAEIHSLFSKGQIGIGLNLIFCNSCSNIPFCYVENDEKLRNEHRKIVAIQNLKHLYQNYFERYCAKSLNHVGDFLPDDRIGYLCYMLWDIFVLYPGNATTEMVNAAVNVMRYALYSQNESCIVSAIHGLGHWVSGADAATPVLEEWLQSPSTQNKEILEYAIQAKTGCIQ